MLVCAFLFACNKVKYSRDWVYLRLVSMGLLLVEFLAANRYKVLLFSLFGSVKSRMPLLKQVLMLVAYSIYFHVETQLNQSAVFKFCRFYISEESAFHDNIWSLGRL